MAHLNECHELLEMVSSYFLSIATMGDANLTSVQLKRSMEEENEDEYDEYDEDYGSEEVSDEEAYE